MRFTALASSSHGNAYIVDDQETRILLECGVSHRKLKQLSGFSLNQFAACLVSHEHKDHAKAVGELIKDGMTIYMSEGTADALETDGVSLCAAMEQFNVGSLDIVPFTTFHDAAEPLGFLIKSRVDGDVLAFATDTVNLRYRFPGLNILAIEANYDKAILERCEKMPEKVRNPNCFFSCHTTPPDSTPPAHHACTVSRMSECRSSGTSPGKSRQMVPGKTHTQHPQPRTCMAAV